MTPPPSLLTSYLPALLIASNALLEHCSQDPTAYGISTAFLESSSQLENALVAYCGIVGNIFATERASKRKLVRSRRNSGAVDEQKRSPPPSNSNFSRSFSRKSLNHPSSSQLPFFGFSDKRKTMPPMSSSSWDISEPFPTVEASSPPASTPSAEGESSQDYKTAPRRSFSLFKRKTSSQTSSPVPAAPKPTKSSWRRFRSSSKISVHGLANSSQVVESPPQHINQMSHRPTRPIPPIPQECPHVSGSGELNKPMNTPRRHNRSASLQEAHIPSAEPPLSMAWNTPNPMRRGGMSLDMNHAIGSAETSTRSSHNIHFGAEQERRERVPTVRDLAILPTQRVMRYVLLFKGS